MTEIVRAYSEEKPSVIQYLGRNKYYYNYDIQEEIIDGDLGQKTVYSYIPVKLINKPDYKRCVRELIRKYVDIDEEFDLINSYIRSVQFPDTLDASSDNNVDEQYATYLSIVNKIKQNVAKDFAQRTL